MVELALVEPRIDITQGERDLDNLARRAARTGRSIRENLNSKGTSSLGTSANSAAKSIDKLSNRSSAAANNISKLGSSGSAAITNITRNSQSAARSVDGIGKAAQRSRGFLAGAASALGAVVGTVIGTTAARGLVQINARAEDLRRTLNATFQDIEKGAFVFKELETLAETSGQELTTLVAAVTQLQGSGFTGGKSFTQIAELLKTIENGATVATDKVGAFEAIIRLLGRSTSGGLGLEELEQVFERIPGLSVALQRELKISRLEFSEFGKTAEGSAKITAALLKVLNEGQFAGAATAGLGGISQSLSNLTDATTRFFTAIGDGGFSAAFTNAVQSLTAFISSGTESARIIGEVLGGAINAVTFAIKQFGEIIAVVGLVALSSTLLALTGVVLKFAGAVSGVTPAIVAVGGATAKSLTILNTFGFSLKNIRSQIRNFPSKVFKNFFISKQTLTEVTNLKDGLDLLKARAGGTAAATVGVSSAFQRFGAVLNLSPLLRFFKILGPVGLALGALQFAINRVTGENFSLIEILKAIAQLITSTVISAFNGFLTVVTDVSNYLGKEATDAIDSITGAYDKFTTFVSENTAGAFQIAKDIIKGFVDGALELINNLVGAADNLFRFLGLGDAAVSGFVQKSADFLSTTVAAAKDGVVGVAEAASAPFIEAGTAISEAISAGVATAGEVALAPINAIADQIKANRLAAEKAAAATSSINKDDPLSETFTPPETTTTKSEGAKDDPRGELTTYINGLKQEAEALRGSADEQRRVAAVLQQSDNFRKLGLTTLSQEAQIIRELSDLKEAESQSFALEGLLERTRLQNEESAIRLQNLGLSERERAIVEATLPLEREREQILKRINELNASGVNTEILNNRVTSLNQEIEKTRELEGTIQQTQRSFEFGWDQAIQNAQENSQNFAQIATDLYSTISDGAADTFSKFATEWDGTLKGALNIFGGFVDSVIQQLTKIALNQVFSSLLGGATGGAAGAAGGGLQGIFDTIFSAKGNVFNNGNVVPFAKGGIINGPTITPMRGNKFSLTGEAGPEAVLPVARTKSGDLGVKVSGGNNAQTTNVFNITTPNPNSFRQSRSEIERDMYLANQRGKRNGG